MRAHLQISLVLTLALGSSLTACTAGGLPQGLGSPTPLDGGPRIVWDLGADPLPELPLPNDVATWPDPTSPTGLRINVSLVAPTQFERDTRRHFDELDGWGTFTPVSVSFDAPIDVQDFYDRQGGSDHFGASAWANHAVYLIDLDTGLPVPLDVNSGNFQYVLDNPSQYWENDPHAGESNLILETREEDVNGNGVLDPGEDTDFDGVLDHPNTFDGLAPADPAQQVDDTVWFYERETNTLLLRPIIPLHGRHHYAVVVTERVRGADGLPVRSPFDARQHVAQREDLASLPDIFRTRPDLYGSLADEGWDGVAFAWKFTTQSTTNDLDALRAGLYGDGSMGWLHDEFPTDYAPAPMQGGRAADGCMNGGPQLYVATADQFIRALDTVARTALGLNPAQADVVRLSYGNLSHVVIGYFDTPYYLGDPYPAAGTSNIHEVFEMNTAKGEARVVHQTITFLAFVPKESASQSQPFPVAFYVHGHGSNAAEPLPFAGFMLEHGVTAVMINAENHGLALPAGTDIIVRSFFANECLKPMFDAIASGRAHDINGNGEVDSGGDFWTAYVFHTRDVVRQSVLDNMRTLQLLRSFDGRAANPVTFTHGPADHPIDFDGMNPGGGGPMIAGDFDGNGRPDFGGPDNRYFFTGGSLGGIVSGVTAGAEPAIQSSAPIVGAGGLMDVGVRTVNGAVLPAMHLRMMGPFVVTAPKAERGEDTACADGENSLYWLTNDVARKARTEFACANDTDLAADSVLIVRNLSNGEVACGGAVAGSVGHFRVPIASDANDLIQVEFYHAAAMDIDYADCHFRSGERVPDRQITSWESGNGHGSAHLCRTCGQFQQRTWNLGDSLVAPSEGFGLRRQSPDLRRLLFLAQVGLEPGDPINYARRVLLDPVQAADTTPHPVNLLVVNSVGDPNVPVSTGNAYARAAGLLPFMPADAPDDFADYRAPASFEGRYPGIATPNDVLIQHHVLEGVDRLNRNPIAGGPSQYLFDADDMSEGRQRFNAAGTHQETDPMAESWQAPRLDPPLRWVRSSRAVSSPTDDVWSPRVGAGISGLLNNYAIPNGVHGFDEIVYPPDTPWDTSQFIINLVARYGATGGTDIRYYTDPAGYTCLESSSCDFSAPAAP